MKAGNEKIRAVASDEPIISSQVKL